MNRLFSALFARLNRDFFGALLRSPCTGVDWDATFFGLFGLRQRDRQHAVAELSFGSLGLDRRRQANRSLERAKLLLAHDPALPFALLLLRFPALAANPQGVAQHGYFDIVGGDSRHQRANDVVVALLHHVDR